MAELAKMANSYHNFIFPFIWQNIEGNDKRPTLEDIKINIENTHVWANDDLDDWHEIELNEQDIQADELNVNHLKYATYQYYQPAIRNAIFGIGNKDNNLEVVQSYYFTPIKNGEGIDNKRAQYYIRKEINVENHEYCLKEYGLDLTDIKLRLYNTGVGLLCFVCENNITTDLADIKTINDYGRRITVPFIPKSNDRQDLAKSVCADYISIYWDGMGEEIGHDFREQIKNINSSKKKADLNHVADFIIKILNYSIGDDNKDVKKFTTNKKDKDKAWYIQPALDDRMFVMCAVRDNVNTLFKNDELCKATDYMAALHPELLCRPQEECVNYKKIEQSLYEFIFCDPSGGCTCQFSSMRQQLLREHLYYRWADFESIYSVAAQAFMCITKPAYLINYFRTEYYEMACLVLVQRASLRQFQNEASYLSAHVEDRDRTVDKQTRQDIANLQEKLIAFQNQINLYEISSQEQAIELYDMMREVFLVNKHASILQEQLDGLYNIANIHQSNNISHWALVVAGAAIVIAFPSFWGDSPVWPGPLGIVSDYIGDTFGCGEDSWSITVFIIKLLVIRYMYKYFKSLKNK